MSSEILRIIEGGLNNDRRKIINYSNRLATRLEAEGNVQLARCIKEQIQSSTVKNIATIDAMRMLPLDSDSKLQIVEVIPEDSTRTNIILSDSVEKQLNEFIELVKHSDELEQAGVNMPKSMLLYGVPGCGKTSIAHYASEKTTMPTSCILIAATNHPELLDNAVWRRFTTKIEIGMPDDDARKK